MAGEGGCAVDGDGGVAGEEEVVGGAVGDEDGGDAGVAPDHSRGGGEGAEHLADLAEREDHYQAEVGADGGAEDGAAEEVGAKEVDDEGGEDEQAVAGGDVGGVAGVEAAGEEVDAVGEGDFVLDLGDAFAEE